MQLPPIDSPLVTLTAAGGGTNQWAIDSGTFNLSLTYLKTTLTIPRVVGAYNKIPSDCIPFINQLTSSCSGKNIDYIEDFATYTKMALPGEFDLENFLTRDQSTVFHPYHALQSQNKIGVGSNADVPFTEPQHFWSGTLGGGGSDTLVLYIPFSSFKGTYLSLNKDKYFSGKCFNNWAFDIWKFINRCANGNWRHNDGFDNCRDYKWKFAIVRKWDWNCSH